MSSFAGYCNDCRKPIMHKTLFGTLHVCVPREEVEASQLHMNQQASSSFLRRDKRFKQVYGASQPKKGKKE